MQLLSVYNFQICMIIIRTLVCPFGLCNISNCFSSTSSSTHSHYLFKWNPNRSKEKELQVDVWNIYFWTKFWILVHCAPRGWLFFAMSDWLSQFRSGSLAAFVYSLPKIKWVLEFQPKNQDIYIRCVWFFLIVPIVAIFSF